MLSFASRVVAAGVAATSFSCSTDAGVVFGSLQSSINIPATSTGLYLNVQTGQASFSESAVPGWDINISGASGLNFISPGGYNFVRLSSAPVTAGPSALSAGFVIGPQLSNAQWITGGAAQGFSLLSNDNVVGFRFAGSDGQTRYGWVRIGIGLSLTGTDRRIVEYAFESTPGAPIVAVPAPGALALLAVSGASVLGRRRRAA
jgi:uncharacterized protein (TIGR03382 family)